MTQQKIVTSENTLLLGLYIKYILCPDTTQGITNHINILRREFAESI
jgi:hypothetical protein